MNIMELRSCPECEGHGTTVRWLENGIYEEPTCRECFGTGKVEDI